MELGSGDHFVRATGLVDSGSAFIFVPPMVAAELGIQIADLPEEDIEVEGLAHRIRARATTIDIGVAGITGHRAAKVYVTMDQSDEDTIVLLGTEPFFRWFDIDFHLTEGHWSLQEQAKAAPNPAPKVNTEAVEKAKREVETFTAYPAKHLRMLSMAPFKSPRTKLCQLETYLYNSPKWTGRMKRYWHEFEDGLKRTVWHTKSGHIIAAGPARNTARGIDDFSLIHRLGRRARSLDEVIRNAKGWAKLADLEMCSLPCAKCGTTLKYDGDGNPQRWFCPRCKGETPKYKLSGGVLYYDPDAKWCIAVAKVS